VFLCFSLIKFTFVPAEGGFDLKKILCLAYFAFIKVVFFLRAPTCVDINTWKVFGLWAFLFLFLY